MYQALMNYYHFLRGTAENKKGGRIIFLLTPVAFYAVKVFF
jgi:hypothetical protein